MPNWGSSPSEIEEVGKQTVRWQVQRSNVVAREVEAVLTAEQLETYKKLAFPATAYTAVSRRCVQDHRPNTTPTGTHRAVHLHRGELAAGRVVHGLLTLPLSDFLCIYRSYFERSQSGTHQ